MMDANRLQQSISYLRDVVGPSGRISPKVALEIATALDELSRIKSAALPETVSSIERRHSTALTAVAPNAGLSAYEEMRLWREAATAAHLDRATLLDALRAKEADQEKARLRYNERVSELIQKVNDVTGERDEARNTRQPARDRFENQVIPEEMIQRAILKPGQAASLGSHVAIDNDGSVVTAEQYNAVLTANRDIRPDQGRYLLPPGRWLVGETTVKLEAAEYICLGSSACGTCRKCLETKAEKTDKERG